MSPSTTVMPSRLRTEAVAPEPEFETGVDGDGAPTDTGKKPGFLSRLFGR